MNIPLDRVREKLDEYFSVNDYKAAERHLIYWYNEALGEKDMNALFFLTNEMIGYYRKQGKKEKSLEYTEKVIALIKEMELDNTSAAATAYINTATAYKAFGKPAEAIPLFRKAENIYNSVLPENDKRKAGLYNNMALALTDTENYEEAEKYYLMAIEITLSHDDGKPDAAISYLNLADMKERKLGSIECEEDIAGYLEKAEELLDASYSETDGYYAFVCEKCAPVFGYYGYFMYEEELKERAVKIYERN